jgi:hypothetical protein
VKIIELAAGSSAPHRTLRNQAWHLVISGQWAVDSGQWTVDSVQWTGTQVDSWLLLVDLRTCVHVYLFPCFSVCVSADSSPFLLQACFQGG